MKKILSIDGGGIRGIIPAIVLAEIEARTGKRIAEMFDLIAGTSTGGILSCFLTAPIKRSAEEIISFYEKDGPNIFNRSFLGKIGIGFGLFGAKYSNDVLKSRLNALLSKSMLSECKPPILVTAYDIEVRQPVFFKSQKAQIETSRNFCLKDVALATASAPTYFPPAKVKKAGDSYALIDGGVFTTNPAMCAYVEAKTMWPDEEIMLVSIGTGELIRKLPYDSAKSWGLANWAQKILDVMFDSTSDVVDYQCQQILGENYTRLQCTLDKASDDMDDASSGNLRLLRVEAEDLIRDNAHKINELCNKLKEK